MNGLLQFQSPETEQAVVFLQPADMSAESRDQSPENDLRKIPENRMVCGVGSTSPITTVVMIFCQSSTDGARASIEGGFFESKKAT